MYWKGQIKPGVYDEMVQNIDYVPTILDTCNIDSYKSMEFDGKSLKNILMKKSKKPVHELLYGEIGFARCVMTNDWKYIAVRYPQKIKDQIKKGVKFEGYKDEELTKPYLLTNPHLGYYSSRQNPHYFEEDQLFYLKKDPEEKNNCIDQYPEKLKEMKKMLSHALKGFNHPFGEFK